MYSHEIDIFLRIRNWTLTTEEYLYITDRKQHPQINRVTYDPYLNEYYISTQDNWHWTIKTEKD